MDCAPEDVFEVLSDGWLYGMWVVGAARVRRVEGPWPEPGACIHHSIGAWPVLLSDVTEVARSERPGLLELTAKAWPAGEARVVITCRPHGEGRTEVTIEEWAVAGPATLLPRPLQDLVLHPRNAETLLRLSHLAEHRVRASAHD